MPGQQHDLHGNAPDKAPVALLLIDVINDLDFAHGKALLKHALPMATKIAALKRRAKRVGIPSIYVNDNFGRWQSDFQHVLRHCLDEDVCGKPLATLLQPDAEDYFVLKAQAFRLLFDHLGALITGAGRPHPDSDGDRREHLCAVYGE